MNHNKHNLKEGEIVFLDEQFANYSIVKILKFTPNQMFAKVTDPKGKVEPWEVMTNRLSPLYKK